MTENFKRVEHLLILLCIVPSVVSLKCNGMEGLCRLTLKQVTLAGTHNAGAGFDGHMKYHSALGPVLASSCTYRSQTKSITSQLDFGIRYFDIDTCWEGNGVYDKGAWSCHANTFGGTIAKMLLQINNWMNKGQNRNEVIVIHFNRDYQKGKEKDIGAHIQLMLEMLWKPTSSRISAGKLSMQSSFYATLGDSVRQNKRIFVIFHSKMRSSYKSYLHSEGRIGYTWTEQAVVGSDGCKKLVYKLAEKCKKAVDSHKSLIRLDLYLTWGLCTNDMASLCNPKTTLATNECYKQTQTKGKTVNLIVVDFVERGGYPNVVEVARRQNIINVKKYSGR